MSTAAVMNDGKVVSADRVMNASEVVTTRMAVAVMTTARVAAVLTPAPPTAPPIEDAAKGG